MFLNLEYKFKLKIFLLKNLLRKKKQNKCTFMIEIGLILRCDMDRTYVDL